MTSRKKIRLAKKALKAAGITSPVIFNTTINSSGFGGYCFSADNNPDMVCIIRLLKFGGLDLASDYPGTDQALSCNHNGTPNFIGGQRFPRAW